MDSPFRRISRLLFALLAYRPPRTEVPPQGAFLAGVTVVNPGLDRRTDQTLVVSGDRITSLSAGPAAPDPPDAGRYRGAYVLPGLIEKHIHFPPPERELAHLLLLAHGVTSARGAGDADGTTWPARRRIRAGRIPGPRLFVCGPVLDGEPPYLPTSWIIRDAAEAEAAVNVVADLGADFIKVHHKLSAEALAGIRAAAERRGLRVAGHIPMAVRFEDARLWDVQHLDGLVPYAHSAEAIRAAHCAWRCLNPDRVDAYVRTSAEQGLVHTPTLASFQAFARLAAPAPALTAAAQWLPRYYRDVVWSLDGALRMFAPFVQEPSEALWQEVEQAQMVVARLHRAGVRLHLGTDAPGSPTWCRAPACTKNCGCSWAPASARRRPGRRGRARLALRWACPAWAPSPRARQLTCWCSPRTRRATWARWEACAR